MGVEILQLNTSEICEEVNKIDFSDKSKYLGSLPDSLMLRKLRKISKREEFLVDGIHEFTTLIIDVDFSKDAIRKLETTHKAKINTGKNKGKEIEIADKETVATKSSVRKKAYNNGIVIEDEQGNQYKYINFQRSSSKSKNGQNLFILEKYYDQMILWIRMGLTFTEKEKVDIASLRAYETLTSSAIEDTIVVDPESILIINDVKGYCKEIASVTTIDTIKSEKKESYKANVEEKEIEIQSDIWDGQSIGDSSLFAEKVKNEQKQQGFYLLRNHMLKTALFNGEIQKFYLERGIKTVTNMFGDEIDASKIKIITTPNSCKFFKFANKIAEMVVGKEEADKLNENKKMKMAWEYWKANIDKDYEFGICQTEHESKYFDGNWMKNTYQFTNTMPFSYEDLEKLLNPSMKYSNLMLEYVSVFKNYINADKTDARKSMVYNLLCVNDKVQLTKLYYNFLKETRNDYRKELTKGRYYIEGDYSVVCSNIYEMLLASTGEEITKEKLLHRRITYDEKNKEYIYSVFCRGYDYNEYFTMCRNPHIAPGNVAVAQNIHKIEFDEYFPNFGKNIIIVDAYDCGVFDRLQGMDVDSDKVAIITNPIVLKRAFECLKFRTPINKSDGDKKLRYLNGDQQAIVDNKIADNQIGRIVNLSMNYVSWYWHYYRNNSDGRYETRLNSLYDAISCLSTLSQIEIDKSKKMFKFNTSKILKDLERTDLIDDEFRYETYTRRFPNKDELEEIKKLKEKMETSTQDSEEYISMKSKIDGFYKQKIIKPMNPDFFKVVFGKKDDVMYYNMDCPMNDVQKIIQKGLRRGNKEMVKIDNIKEILTDVKLSKANTTQIKKMADIAIQAKKEISKVYLGAANTNEEKKERRIKVQRIKQNAIENLPKVITSVSVAQIIYSTYNKENCKYEDNSGREVDYGFFLLSLISKAQPKKFAYAFKNSSGVSKELIEYKNGNIEIFGRKYVEADTNFVEIEERQMEVNKIVS